MESSDGLTVVLEDETYIRIVMHAAKHIGAVYGLLLGRLQDERIVVSEVLPVAHSALVAGTSPLTEIALKLAQEHAKLCGLAIVGMYYAPEIADDIDIPVLPTRLADLIRDDFDQTCILLLEAKKLHPDVRSKEHCLRLYSLHGVSTAASWAKGLRKQGDLSVSDAALRECSLKLEDISNAQFIVDFEDHCNDPRRPWLPRAS